MSTQIEKVADSRMDIEKSLCLQTYINHSVILLHRAPQIPLLALNFNEYLVDEERITVVCVHALKSMSLIGRGAGVHWRIVAQARFIWHYPAAHFIWGCADDIFTEQWGRQWASRIMGATFDAITDAGHFLQNTHGEEIVQCLLARIDAQ